MQQTITITPQWQIYLPQQVRDALGLLKPGKVLMEIKKKAVVIRPPESEVLKLAGKYKHLYKKNPINIDKVRDYVDFSKI